MVLVLAQMAMWYQFRPFAPGESIYVKVWLTPLGENDGDDDPLMRLTVRPSEGVAPQTPPLRIETRREYAQRFSVDSPGVHALRIGNDAVELPIVVGGGFARTVPRAGGSFWDRLLYPGGPGLSADADIEAVQVMYPPRAVHVPILSWLLGWIGLDHWLLHYFVLATIIALLCKPFMRVHL
jgi:hypothetical protein